MNIDWRQWIIKIFTQFMSWAFICSEFLNGEPLCLLVYSQIQQFVIIGARCHSQNIDLININCTGKHQLVHNQPILRGVINQVTSVCWVILPNYRSRLLTTFLCQSEQLLYMTGGQNPNLQTAQPQKPHQLEWRHLQL